MKRAKVNSDKLCANAACRHAGVWQPLSNFYARIKSADGRDNYCKECRHVKNQESYMKDPDRADEWKERAKMNAVFRREKYKRSVDYQHKQAICKKHPWMLDDKGKPALDENGKRMLGFLAEECEVGECGQRKIDKRFWPRSVTVKAKISEAMRGRCNNAKGVNLTRGHQRTKRVRVSITARQSMRDAAFQRWAKVRSEKEVK